MFFQGDRLTGIIDFYFACVDLIAYDLAICLNAWCFEPDGAFNITKARQMLAAYRAERSTPRELDACCWPAAPPCAFADAAVRLAEPGRGRPGQAQGSARIPREAALPPRRVRPRRLWAGPSARAPDRRPGTRSTFIHGRRLLGNPGPGGWGVCAGRMSKLPGFEPATNRMELLAAISALET